MKRVLYRTAGQTDWLTIIERLQSRYDWSPAVWLDPRFTEDEIRETDSDVEFMSSKAANRRGLPERGQTEYQPLDAEILERYEPYRPDILRSMDRFDPGNGFSYDERVRHYHRQLRYWRRTFDRDEIDAVVFAAWPHQPSGLVINAVCAVRDIDFAYITNPLVPGLLRVDGDPRGVNERLADRYMHNRSELDVDDLSPASRAHIEALSQAHPSPGPDSSSASRYFAKLSQIHKYPEFARKLFRPEWRKIVPGNKTIEDAEITLARKMVYEKKLQRHKRRLKKEYGRLATTPDLSANYVYFPLHYEPEASLNPVGEQFRNQFNAIDLLSKTVPDDWRIYVKEHPAQYKINKATRGRHGYDYRDLDTLTNVTLVDLSTSTYDLIDRSHVTASVTGTAAWEAVVRGTPAFVFGNARFRLCDGVFYVRTAAAVENALVKIRDDYEPDETAVLQFVRALELVGFRGYVTDYHKSQADVDQDANIANTVEALHRFFESD